MGESPPTPDFFIVGAPKCATSSLAHYLGQHPELGMCREKDSTFLLREEPGRLAGNAAYLALFAGLEGRRRVGDASVLSLYSERALANIAALCAEPKIIVCLRRPEEMLPALHAQQIRNSGAPAETFERAWRAERDGAPAAVGSPTRAPDPPGTYRAAGRYAGPLRRYVEAFGPANVLVLDFAELTGDTARQVADVYRFLGVDAGFVPETPVVNAHHRLRVRRFRQLLYTPPPALSRAARTFLGSRQRAAIASRLLRLNASLNVASERRRPIPAELRDELVREFERDQVELAAILAQLREGASAAPALERAGDSTSSR